VQTDRPPLHVLFTMDCEPAGTRAAPEGPRGWAQSAAAIDGFCTRLLAAGYHPTLFLSPACAREHAPLCEEVGEAGTELALLVHPRWVSGGFGHLLGRYSRTEQKLIVHRALDDFQQALGVRPASVRSALYSASDETFGVLHELGFRQGSLSSPGRRISHHAAVWTGAVPDPHYVDDASRLRAGSLPFLEIPVTTDPAALRGGIAADLAVENGTVEAWHRPLITGVLRRMAERGTRFRALCFVTRNRFAYHDDRDPLARTLDEILRLLDELAEQNEIVPCTAAEAHIRFRMTDGERIRTAASDAAPIFENNHAR
jgi:hypothetical protein